MADASDVSATLVGLISGFIYPNGTSNPSAAAVDARVFVGWPVPATLQTDISNDVCQISVYPLPTERNTTRYESAWQNGIINTPTLTLTALGQTVTVGGAVAPANNPHNACIFVGGIPYIYAVQPTDTIVTVATALATLINAAVPGTLSSGPQILLPGTAVLGPVRVGVTGSSILEIRRQEKLFQITIWANTPQNRSALAKTIDPALAAMHFINLPDLTGGRLIYRNNRESDTAEKQQVYRRDLIYSVEYPTIQTQTLPQILTVEQVYSVAVAGVPPYVPIATEFS